MKIHSRCAMNAFLTSVRALYPRWPGSVGSSPVSVKITHIIQPTAMASASCHIQSVTEILKRKFSVALKLKERSDHDSPWAPVRQGQGEQVPLPKKVVKCFVHYNAK